MAVLIHFETHSTTTDNEAGIATGWLPGLLSESGRFEAQALGGRILSRNPAAVFVSDLGRARDTVKVGLDGAPVDLFYDWRLRECNYGEWNGATRDQVMGAIEEFLYQPYPGGESWDQAVSRAESAIGDLVRMWDGATVIVVGHVSTKWALDRLVYGLTLEDLIAEDFGWQPGWSYMVRAS